MEKRLYEETFSLNDESLSNFVNRNKIDRSDILQIVSRKSPNGIPVYTLFYYAEKAYPKQRG